MTEPEKAILECLLELERTVQSIPSVNPKPNLLPLFSRLDDLMRQLPPQTDPTLRHYLQQRSYQKARLFLQGQEAANTPRNCRHV
jgi:hypothetical protein